MILEDTILRILIATICGSIIGYDRARKGRNAGTKTHAIVAIGSALAMIIGESIYLKNAGGSDPARIPSQVIAGMGFLGAGAIIVTGEKKVTGLTTAATLWLSTIVGIAAGAGLYIETLISMIGWAITFSVLNFIDNHINANPASVSLFIKMKKTATKLSLVEFLKIRKCDIISVTKVLEDDESFKDEYHYIVNVNLDYTMNKEKLLNDLKKEKGIIYINIVDNDN